MSTEDDYLKVILHISFHILLFINTSFSNKTWNVQSTEINLMSILLLFQTDYYLHLQKL